MRIFTIILLLAFLACAVFGVYLAFFADHGSTVYDNPRVSRALVRGTVFDRNGNILAIDVPAYSIEVDSSAIADTSYLADCLARYSDTPRREINDVLLTGHGKISADINKLRDLEEFIAANHLNGYIRINSDYGRIYPTLAHASHLIARTESEFDSYLTATPELGCDISYGDDIYLNLDLDLQYRIDDAISGFCTRNRVSRAGMIIMNSSTGEILTYSVYPWFDLMEPAGKTDDFMLYGDYSTSKLLDAIKVSAAVSSSTAPLFYYCSGTGKCAGHPHGEISVDNAFRCRSAIDYWLSAVPAATLSDTLSALGTDGKITPLSLLKAATAANGDGSVAEPYFVSKLTDIDGNILEKRSRKAAPSPLNGLAADTLKILLRTSGASEQIAFCGPYEIFAVCSTPGQTESLVQAAVSVLSQP